MFGYPNTGRTLDSFSSPVRYSTMRYEDTSCNGMMAKIYRAASKAMVRGGPSKGTTCTIAVVNISYITDHRSELYSKLSSANPLGLQTSFRRCLPSQRFDKIAIRHPEDHTPNAAFTQLQISRFEYNDLQRMESAAAAAFPTEPSVQIIVERWDHQLQKCTDCSFRVVKELRGGGGFLQDFKNPSGS